MNKLFDKDYEKKFFAIIVIALLLDVVTFWVNQKALFDKLNIPSLILISDLSISLLITPIEKILSGFLKPRNEWQFYFFYLSIALFVFHEISSLCKEFYKKTFGDKSNPTNFAKGRRFLANFSFFVFVFPFSDVRIFAICCLTGIYIFLEREIVSFLLLLSASLVIFSSLTKDASIDGEMLALQCQHPVILKMKEPKDEYQTGCWIYENSKSVLIKSISGQNEKSLSTIVYSKDIILSYSFIGDDK